MEQHDDRPDCVSNLQFPGFSTDLHLHSEVYKNPSPQIFSCSRFRTAARTASGTAAGLGLVLARHHCGDVCHQRSPNTACCMDVHFSACVQLLRQNRPLPIAAWTRSSAYQIALLTWNPGLLSPSQLIGVRIWRKYRSTTLARMAISAWKRQCGRSCGDCNWVTALWTVIFHSKYSVHSLIDPIGLPDMISAEKRGSANSAELWLSFVARKVNCDEWDGREK